MVKCRTSLLAGASIGAFQAGHTRTGWALLGIAVLDIWSTAAEAARARAYQEAIDAEAERRERVVMSPLRLVEGWRTHE